MNAATARVETRVLDEDRLARIESDVAEIRDDVKTVNIRLTESIVANAREFGSLRTDTEKRFGALQVAIESNKTETEKSFGAVRVEIEKAKLWMLLLCIGTLGSLLMSILNYFSHTSRIP